MYEKSEGFSWIGWSLHICSVRFSEPKTYAMIVKHINMQSFPKQQNSFDCGIFALKVCTIISIIIHACTKQCQNIPKAAEHLVKGKFPCYSQVRKMFPIILMTVMCMHSNMILGCHSKNTSANDLRTPAQPTFVCHCTSFVKMPIINYIIIWQES